MKKIALLICLLTAASQAFSQHADSARVNRSTGTTSTYSTSSTTSPSTTRSSAADDATVRLGIRLAPSLAFNSAQGEGISEQINNNGTEIRLGGGLTADFFLDENYAFSTGLWYMVKRSAFRNISFPSSSDPNQPTLRGSSEYNLQYLQIPVSLKLYTSEIAPDARVYFQLGGTFDVKLAEKEKGNRAENALYQLSRAQDTRIYKPIDVGLLLGVGVEVRLSDENSIFGGLTYNRGLINAIRGGVKDEFDQSLSDNFKSLNSLLSLEIGLKF